jgi:hypothetical protein
MILVIDDLNNDDCHQLQLKLRVLIDAATAMTHIMLCSSSLLRGIINRCDLRFLAGLSFYCIKPHALVFICCVAANYVNDGIHGE